MKVPQFDPSQTVRRKHNKRAQRLLEINKVASATFCSSGALLKRQQYQKKHPTKIAFLKCMDARVASNLFSTLPHGIAQAFQELGGKFNLGATHFADAMNDWLQWAVIEEGGNAIVFITYHFSGSDPHLGCAGHGYDKAASIRYTAGLAEQFRRVYGSNHIVYPIQVGLDTDTNALILHHQNGEINLADYAPSQKTNEELSTDLHKVFREAFPEMVEQMITDLAQFALGNIQKQREQKQSAILLDHNEYAIVVGRGLDWMGDNRNEALIIGPFTPFLETPIKLAAGVLHKNITRKKSPVSTDDGLVLMACTSTFAPMGDAISWQLRTEKACYLARKSLEIIEQSQPSLVPHLDILVGVVDMGTRRFHEIDYDPRVAS